MKFTTFIVILISPFCALAQVPEKTEPPKPQPIKVVVPAKVQGEGTEQAPYVFTVGMKGDIRLATDTDKVLNVTWLLKDPDTEILPDTKRIWFATEVPNQYWVVASWVEGDKAASMLIWYKIVGNGTTPGPNKPGPIVPPPPVEIDQSIVDAVKAALTGPTAKKDAETYRAGIDALIPNLQAGQYPTLFDLNTAYRTSLNAAGWQTGKYPKLSTLAGEIFGKVGTPDKQLTPESRADLIKQFQSISKACKELEK